MPEDQEQSITARGLKTELIAPIATTVGTILAGVLKESLPQQALATLLIVSLALLSIFAWTYTAILHRQRSKISKLESDVGRLESDRSSLRNPPPIEELKRLSDVQEKILLFISEKREVRTELIASHVGAGIDKTMVFLSDLAEPKFIYIQHYIDRLGTWNMGDIGRRYLVTHDLIQ